MKRYKDFEKGGFVSVWVGNDMSAAHLDDYLNLSRQFEQDFGFQLDDRNMPETTTEDGLRPLEILLQGFSWSDRYKNAVLAEAKRQQISEGSSMIVFFNFCYDPSLAFPRESPDLKFLCAVPF